MCTVTRDAHWNGYFREAQRLGELQPEKVANSMWLFRARSAEANAGIGRVKFLTKAPPVTAANKVAAKCQAVNMNNTQCQFKAVCGKFCKKHRIVAP